MHISYRQEVIFALIIQTIIYYTIIGNCIQCIPLAQGLHINCRHVLHDCSVQYASATLLALSIVGCNLFNTYTTMIKMLNKIILHQHTPIEL